MLGSCVTLPPSDRQSIRCIGKSSAERPESSLSEVWTESVPIEDSRAAGFESNSLTSKQFCPENHKSEGLPIFQRISPFLLRNIFTCRNGRASDATGSGASTTRCISRCEAICFRRAANSRTARSVCSRRSAPLPPEPPPTRHPYRNRSFTAEVQSHNHTIHNHCHID